MSYIKSHHHSDLLVCSISSHRRLGASQQICFYIVYFSLYKIFLSFFDVTVDDIALFIMYNINITQKYHILSKEREMTYTYELSPWPRGEQLVFVYPKCIIYFDVAFKHIELKLILNERQIFLLSFGI